MKSDVWVSMVSIIYHHIRSRRIVKYCRAFLYSGILYAPFLSFKTLYKLSYSILGTKLGVVGARMYVSDSRISDKNKNNG